MNIKYENSVSVEEFNLLRVAVGWSAIEAELTAKGLEHSAFVVCARDGEKAIGMARVITDYGYVVFVTDVTVLPEYQGKGIGGELMRRVMAYINENIAPGQRKAVQLMSKKGKEEFYEKYGFVQRPNETDGCGMVVWIEGAAK
ncbi:MAG: GNAT family N-acetyltransferase [Defluviitaleaceae bacterium]|nr:GNAT family N-acetyltransferase [Defluviitaleaceae bacterium]